MEVIRSAETQANEHLPSSHNPRSLDNLQFSSAPVAIPVRSKSTTGRSSGKVGSSHFTWIESWNFQEFQVHSNSMFQRISTLLREPEIQFGLRA